MSSKQRTNSRKRTRRDKRAGLDPQIAIATIALCVGLMVISWWTKPERERPQRTALSADEARLANAAIPFARGGVRPAPPFRFHGSPAAREQATACLATAALYEAGDDVAGQRAVMQVVLNRVGRRPYPPTVCGVVYQGATLPSGCQFSFACDGSARRRPERAGWAAARGRARRALGGEVYRPVGSATHYHADYVVPYWLGSLDKTAVVGAHIFYRPRQAARANAAAAGVSFAG